MKRKPSLDDLKGSRWNKKARRVPWKVVPLKTRISNIVKGLSEIKSIDWEYKSNTIGTALVKAGACVHADANITAGWTHVNKMIQGTAQSQMVGCKAALKSVRLKMAIEMGNNVTGGAGTYVKAFYAVDQVFVRYCLILDKDCNQVAPTFPEVFGAIKGDGTSWGVAPVQWNTPLLPTEGKRFRVLRDKTVPLQLYGGEKLMVDEYVRFKDEPFVTAAINLTGHIDDIKKGAIYLMFWYEGMDQYVNTPPRVNWITCRTKFRDI